MKILYKIFINIFLTCISTIFILCSGELLLRLTRFKDIIKGGVPRYYLTKDSFAGHDIVENSPIMEHYLYGNYRYKIWSNELGCFDNPYEGKEDFIILVGDSFTWGYTDFEKKYGTILEKLLQYRILKCGVLAYGTLQEYYKIKKIVKKTGRLPRLIIVGYYIGNDIEDDFVRHTVIDGYLIRKEEIDITSGKKIIYSDDELEEQIKNYKRFGAPFKKDDTLLYKFTCWLAKNTIIGRLLVSANIMRKLGKKTGPIKDIEFIAFLSWRKYPYLKTAWSRHLQNILKIKKLANKYGCRLLFVLIPTREQVYEFLRVDKNLSWVRPNRLLKDFFIKYHIDFLDLLPFFKKNSNQKPRMFLDSKKDFYWKYDGHWNERGNYYAALIIAEYILKKRLLNIQNRELKLTRVHSLMQNLLLKNR